MSPINWHNEAMAMWRQGIKPKDMVVPLSHYFSSDKDRHLIKDSIRKYIEGTDEYKRLHCTKATDNVVETKRPVGVFSDPHIPFDHPNYLQFLIDTFKQYNVEDVICLGDLVDNHALSRFQKEPCAVGTYDELDMSIDRVAKYVKAFPSVKLCIGNHDSRIKSRAAEAGIGERYLKPFADLLRLPETWEIAEEYIIDNVLYKHGINCGGKDGALNTALQERMSTCIGHYHSNGGVKYSANKRDLIFGMNVGCGIDIAAYAFIYGQNSKYRPTLGCGLVYSNSNAVWVPMCQQYFRN